MLCKKEYLSPMWGKVDPMDSGGFNPLRRTDLAAAYDLTRADSVVLVSGKAGLVGDLSPARASRGLIMNGVANDRCFVTTTNQNLGTDDFSVYARFRVPLANPVNLDGIWYFGPSATTVGSANTIDMRINTGGVLTVLWRLEAGAVNTFSTTVNANAVVTYGGQIIDVCFVRRGTAAPLIYINGAVVATTSALGGTGTYNGSVNSGFFGIGFITGVDVFIGAVFKVTPYNYALSAADVLAVYNNNGNPLTVDRWGTQVNQLADGSFEVGVSGASASGANTLASVNAVAEGITAVAGTNVLKTTGRAANDFVFWFTQVAALNTKMRLKGSIYTKTAARTVDTSANGAWATIIQKKVDDGVVAGATAITANVWHTFEILISLNGAFTNTTIWAAMSGNEDYYLDAVTIDQVGAFAHYDFTTATKLATVVNDASTNALNATIVPNGDIGSRLAGERDLVNLTPTKQPIYLPWIGLNYCYLPGIAGNYLSTPDSVANSQLGSYCFAIDVTMSDWTPAADSVLVAKWDTGTANRCYLLLLKTTGIIELQVSSDGGTVNRSIVPSTVAVPFVDGSRGAIRVDWNHLTGATDFYTSINGGATWTVLGAQVAGGARATFDGTNILEIGSNNIGTGTLLTGQIHSFKLFSGAFAANAVVVNFNTQLVANHATSFVSSTGETWTVNATGINPTQIVGLASALFDGTDDRLQAPAFSLPQPLTVYAILRQVTWTDADGFFDGNAGTTTWVEQRVLTPQIRSRTPANTGGQITTFALSVNGVITTIFNGATSGLRHNRNAATVDVLQATAADGFQLGLGAGAFGNFQAVAVFIFNTAHATALQDLIIQWLGRKAAITV